ncbi:MAG: sulfatase-like hydrolase/transferase [Bryobacterales bacterium]|nr:sulfatase-like hydrolase/transferase [Bryobacterales bacterium]
MPAISRRRFLGAPLALPARLAARTNVVLFMTDDHGAWAMGCYGCGEMYTPNLDRLAATGARFERAYAATPVSSPSRMTYFTGLMPSSHGVQDYLTPEDTSGPHSRRFLHGLTTFSELLAHAGYTLGFCGKWHMGQDEAPQAGFTYWVTVPGGSSTYRDPALAVQGRRTKIQGFKTDIITDYALEFLDRQRTNPFFLMVSYCAPHTPYDFQPESHRAPYAQSRFQCFPRAAMHPRQNPQLRRHHHNEESMRSYSALVTGVDHNLGRVLRRLEELKVRENTLVVFTADQGWMAGHHGVWGKGNGTIPFNMYEESVRVPLIWNHPGRIPQGLVIREMVANYDFFPTLLEYLGVGAPPDRRRPGRSYLPQLAGHRTAWRERLYFEYAYVRAVRTDRYKYVERTPEWPSELYDLESDPGESRNVSEDPAYRNVLEALRRDLEGFFRGIGAPPLADWRKTTRQKLPSYPNP